MTQAQNKKSNQNKKPEKSPKDFPIAPFVTSWLII